jgi:hypothetical protein
MGNIEKTYLEFKESQERFCEVISPLLKIELSLFEKYFNLQQDLFYNHLPGIFDETYNVYEYERIVIQCYIKSTHLLYSSIQLILRGDFGAARIILRQIFEYLLIAKYFYTKKPDSIVERWLNEKQFDVYDAIIKLLKVPDKKNFHAFWILLCSQAHAGTTSFQIGIGNNENVTESIATFHITLMLLCLKNDLLANCFINTRLKYRTIEYGHNKESNQELQKELKKTTKEIQLLFTDVGISLIKDYKSKWIFKK